MNLYVDLRHATYWVAFSPEAGWVHFPATVNGWDLRQPVRDLDPMHLREVPILHAVDTGMPGAPGTPALIRSAA